MSHPIRSILERWIFEGELQDNYNEFFVAADPAVRNEKLWYDKYSIRKQMLPSFIPNELATKVCFFWLYIFVDIMAHYNLESSVINLINLTRIFTKTEALHFEFNFILNYT